MKTLDEQIADIEKLDDLRRQARKLRQEAIDVLSAESYVPRPRPAPERDDWEKPGDEVEKAQVLRALRIGKAKDRNLVRQTANRQTLVDDLLSIQYKHLTSGHGRDNVPVLRAAHVLQALAEIPGLVFSPTAMACFCRIVQELNDVADPAWTAGAARADKKSIATAFVTGECARALLALEDALRQTEDAAKLLMTAEARADVLAKDDNVWAKREGDRLRRSLEVSLAALPHVMIETVTDQGKLKEEPAGLRKKIESALSRMGNAQVIMGNRPKPPGPYPAKAPDRMRAIVSSNLEHAANVIAWDALDRLHKALRPAAGSDLISRLDKGAQVIRDLLGSIEQFAESTIDRQIAAASQYLSVPVDGAELVFAANLLGLVSSWKRPKIRAAYEVLYPLLSSNGRLLSIKPFDLDSDGYRLNVATLEVTRRFADLIAHLDVEPEPEFVTRLMLPLEYTRTPGPPAKSGWTNDPPRREPKSLWWLTAIAAGTLESVVHMLDKTINRRVLSQFHVRQPESFSVTLDTAFYPDYGIAAWREEEKARHSIAIELQQLRAHVGHGPPEDAPLFSLILYGPPGTGKTTLVEAVAASAKVPLVEVTPSDILVGGVEGIERRARQVFLALSKLTHVVILFDEFEQILLERVGRNEETPTSVIEFLTPGMLPKLKTLYDASKINRVSYVLATNYLDTVDRAVKRDGRFDRRRGIYPPDVVSRLGRLHDQFRSFARNEAVPANPAARKRIAEIVKRTAGCPMGKLGSRGWFTAPENRKKAENMPFGYILDPNLDFEDIKPEAEYLANKAAAEKRKKNQNPDERYWAPWETIRAADRTFKPPAGAITDAKWRRLIKRVDASFKPPR